ncbi:ribonuclease Oy-like [Babylonia areolata]|uniref:ribonuclease Oy-like n=1 Tax=Babylonia areolata TaxID=304850 RepID=UPI003FD6815F
MKGETTKLVFVFFIIFCLKFGHSRVIPKADEFWDTLILTRSWAPATCLMLENEGRKCEVSNFNSWVIHGLWPTKRGTEGPNYCNDTWKFDINKVESLLPRMKQTWPSIAEDEKPEDTWKHEWEKHGTCGTSLPALKDEVHYFNVTMNLHAHYNLSLTLKNGNIVPADDRTYKATDVLEALHQELGVYPNIACVRDKKNGKFYLEQIEMCMTKEFQLADCASHSSQEAGHELLFQSETIHGTRKRPSARGSHITECGSDEIYYKPMSSM